MPDGTPEHRCRHEPFPQGLRPIEERLPEQIARNAGRLRDRTGRASEISAVDAVVISMAEPDGIVLSTDPEDLGALAAHALGVAVERP